MAANTNNNIGRGNIWRVGVPRGCQL